MLIIRLQRVGRTHEPTFRIVLTDSKFGPKSGKAVEVLGSYDARKGKGNNHVDGEKVKYWISKGAQVSDTVHNFLIDQNVLTGKKINVLPKNKIIDANKAKAEAESAKEAEKKVVEEAPAQEPAPVDAPVEETKTETPIDQTPSPEPVESPAEPVSDTPTPEVVEEKVPETAQA